MNKQMLKNLTNKNSTTGKKHSPVVKMTSKKIRSFSTTRIIPYFLILIILVGLFSPMAQVHAATTPAAAPDTGGIGNNLNSCRIIGIPHLNGCYEQIISWIFYEIPSFLLGVAGNFFNVIISLTLSSNLYEKATFVGNAWTVVRDLSNIFFILVLLYVAIQTILGMGHETKKIIVQVIVMALLINFSMFFTKIVIDSSNILALVFYNKITVSATGNYIPVVSVKNSGVQDKDISGAMMRYFDPTKVLSKEFFDKFRKTTYSISAKGALASAGAGALMGSWIPIIGTGVGAAIGTVGYFISSSSNDIPTGIVIGFILSAGLIISFAAYAFFIAGLSFLSRMIELWILIIFSPFAFMSSTLPKLSSSGYIGWDAWIKRLLKLSFMAPVFMFFLYLIFMIIQSNIFTSLVDRAEANQGWMETIILMIIPALVILILLYKTTKFAKEASGELGSMVIGGAKLVAGLAVGGAALGGALAGKTLLGSVAKSVQTSDATRRNAFTFKDTKEKWSKGGLNRLRAIGGIGSAIGKASSAYTAELIHKAPSFTKDATGAPVTLGKYMQKQDEGFGHKTHATHILDAKMQSEFGHTYGKDAKYKDLTEHEQGIVKAEVDKDEMSKFVYGKLFKDLEAPQAAAIQARYKGTDYTDPVTGTLVAAGPAQRPIDDGDGRTVRVADSTAALGPHEQFKSNYFVDMSKSNAAIGEFVQALRKGSYDIRNLPNKPTTTLGALGTAALFKWGTIATLLTLALKKDGTIERGAPQKTPLQDIGNMISEALKNVNINVSSGGGHGGGDDHAKEVKSVGH